MHSSRLVLGAMTGTSLDGLDVALARIEGTGLGMRVELLAHDSADLGSLGSSLRAAAEQTPLAAGACAELALALGHLYAAALHALCARARVRPDLAAIHGQTIFHQPPRSWQVINPHPVADSLRCPVVFDLRGADLCEGGQGAPLTPLADWVLFRGPEHRAIVNLGGFANATLLGPTTADVRGDVAAIRGRDLCACNHVLDRAAREVLHQPFDRDGAVAMGGNAHAEALAAIISSLTPALDGRSLGTGDEAWSCIAAWRAQLDPPTLLATMADAVGTCIGRAIAATHARHVILAGGGARHPRVVQALARAAGAPVQLSSERGVPVEARESLEWAVLGALAQDGVTVSVPAITGRRQTRLSDGLWCLPQGFQVSERTG